ncbi:unnamed protein product [Somion occarium]|uniref:Uncharacterized protein n=1 Tax=Somion occarium TaxID=3059160 RepID=A0ABP1DPR4_9APHY
MRGSPPTTPAPPPPPTPLLSLNVEILDSRVGHVLPSRVSTREAYRLTFTAIVIHIDDILDCNGREIPGNTIAIGYVMVMSKGPNEVEAKAIATFTIHTSMKASIRQGNITGMYDVDATADLRIGDPASLLHHVKDGEHNSDRPLNYGLLESILPASQIEDQLCL